MSPEFGATSTLFPIDDETLSYLRLTGRTADRVSLVERYAKEQGLWREPGPGPDFDEVLELDLATVDPSVAGPRPPQDRVPLTALRASFRSNFPNGLVPDGEGRPRAARPDRRRPRAVRPGDREDVAGARVEGRHRVPRGGRADGAAGAPRICPRRIRLHDLHRELRTPRRADRPGDRGE